MKQFQECMFPGNLFIFWKEKKTKKRNRKQNWGCRVAAHMDDDEDVLDVDELELDGLDDDFNVERDVGTLVSSGAVAGAFVSVHASAVPVKTEADDDDEACGTRGGTHRPTLVPQSAGGPPRAPSAVPRRVPGNSTTAPVRSAPQRPPGGSATAASPSLVLPTSSAPRATLVRPNGHEEEQR